jgi:hypothetical protein
LRSAVRRTAATPAETELKVVLVDGVVAGVERQPADGVAPPIGDPGGGDDPRRVAGAGGGDGPVVGAAGALRSVTWGAGLERRRSSLFVAGGGAVALEFVEEGQRSRLAMWSMKSTRQMIGLVLDDLGREVLSAISNGLPRRSRARMTMSRARGTLPRRSGMPAQPSSPRSYRCRAA